MKREDWNTYFMQIAIQTSTRATCDRLHAGVILVRDKMVLSGGYNGSPRGLPHCTDEGVGCLMVDGHCKRTVHSEANAIVQAARTGVNISGTTAYVTHIPCYDCFKLLINVGVVKIFYNQYYDNKTNDMIFNSAKEIDFPIEQVLIQVKLNQPR